MTRRPELLFLCVHNAGRSQMAAAFARQRAGGDLVVHSAGSTPADRLNPAVVTAMAEVGLDISSESPQGLRDEVARRADVVVTMGCGDTCPVYPHARHLDWDLDDPAGKSLEEVRVIRDSIRRHVTSLIDEMLSPNE